MNWRKLIRNFIKLLYATITVVEAEGFENIPTTGAVVGAANHNGRLDVGLIYFMLERDDVVLMIAEKYRKSAFWRWVAKQFDLLFVDRFNADLALVRQMQKRLKQGQLLAIAPEGTRSPTGQLQQGRPGAIYLAASTGSPILPTALTGTRDREVLANLKRFRRTRIKVIFGKPFHLPLMPRENREEYLEAQTEALMLQIAAMLPEDYRGVYADHPGLKSQQPDKI